MPKIKKAVVIGIDGLDFQLINQFLNKGLLPNLNKLKQTGYYSSLTSTIPPQSPVAWSSFITGARPQKHGVFDFIVRDPKTYLLFPVFSPSAKKSVHQSPPFWNHTTKHKIPTQIFFLPTTYPPQKLLGQMISGMGTPDILGTEGTFTLLTTNTKLLKSKRGIRIKLPQNQTTIKSFIHGPKIQTFKGIKVSTIPLTITKLKNSVKVKIQNQSFSLKPNEFSPWINLSFKLSALKTVKGIAKFFLKSLSPHLTLHLSPINIDPTKPVFPVSHPKIFASHLAKDHGLFSTLGLPVDTWSLQDNIFSEIDFLAQADSIQSERQKIIFDNLKKFESGLFVAYFGTPDPIQHMFFKDFQKSGPYKNIVPNYYQKMDRLIGKVQKIIGSDTLLVILSDHGFGHFDWEINLNTWLKDNSFLKLTKGSQGSELYENVDWSKTQAFAAGFNSIYLNLKGREQHGIVPLNKATTISKSIKEKLLKLKNPKTKKPVIKNIYTRKDLNLSPGQNTPDLIVGYFKGFRASWETAVGATPLKVIKKRTQKWGGDHLFDVTEIPGVLFSNQKLKLKDPFIGDVMPQVLEKLAPYQ